jgi:putative ABC transport system permease protein
VGCAGVICRCAGLLGLSRHPLLTALGVLGIALGVAAVVSVDLANESALRAFRLSADAVAGRATHQVVGGPGGLPEELYRTLRVEQGVRAAAPVVEGYAATAVRAERFLRILGVDPFAEGAFRGYTAASLPGTDLALFLTRPGAGLLTEETAAHLDLAVGNSLTLTAGGADRSFLLLGLLRPEDDAARRALSMTAVVDVAAAQEFLGLEGRLSRIDLAVPPGPEGDGILERIRTVLPLGALVLPVDVRRAGLERMIRAFRINLLALSLLSLVVGMFLVHNTMTFQVLRRRQLIGTLRALGATRRQVLALVAGHALLVGAAGTALGLLLGTALANVLLRLVTMTINDLYFVLSVHEVAVTPLSLAKALALGLGATVISAAGPAFEAATTVPGAALRRSAIEARFRKSVPAAALVGAAVAALGAGLLLAPRGGLAAGFGGLFAVIVGFALTVPAATLLLLGLARPLMGAAGGTLGSLAARNVAASLSRTGVAIAALSIAVSATIGVGIMIGSFRATLVLWLESALRADLYVTASGPDRGAVRTPLDPALVERLAATSGVSAVVRARRAVLESADGPIEMFVVDIPDPSLAGFPFKEGNREAALRALLSSEAVIVSEPYALRNGLSPGDAVRLRTDRGEHSFPVAGVYYDYGSDRGVVTLSLRTYRAHWDDPAVDSLGIYLEPGADPAAAADRLRDRAEGASRVAVTSSRDLREASLAVFDRTFAVTSVLRLLSVLIAVVGILSALASLEIERAREHAVLRALGLLPRRLFVLIACETGLIGLVAGTLAVPLGLVQALVLIRIVIRRAFGWTLQVRVDPEILLTAVVLSIVAAFLAGLYPAFRMARIPPATALREE